MKLLHKSKIFTQLINSQTIHYATITSNGINLPMTKSELKSLRVKVLAYGEARTYYENKRPICRSFNGENPQNNKDKKCEECERERNCTLQVYIDCENNKQSMRILLSYTSAQNFLYYVQRKVLEGKEVENSELILRVQNRGNWGEVIFE